MGEENEGLDFNSVIFRAYDIRGVFGEELTCEVAYEIAKAIGTMARKKNQQNAWMSRNGNGNGGDGNGNGNGNGRV